MCADVFLFTNKNSLKSAKVQSKCNEIRTRVILTKCNWPFGAGIWENIRRGWGLFLVLSVCGG